MTKEVLHQEYAIRCEKAEKMRAMGIEPWPEQQDIPHTCHQVIQEFSDTNEQKTYTVAGRIMALREHGKTIFAHIQDRSGKLQIYLRSDDLGEDSFSLFRSYTDIGDIISCSGYAFRTKKGEITLHVDKVRILSKCLRPLPEKFHGLTDIDTKYRQRYLDLMTSEETRHRFILRSKIISTIRSHLVQHDFLEVETPMLHPIPGGAAARPFVTHHNTLHSDFYLRIAPELYLKRLVVGGFERVFEINRNFRNEGVSTRHNPEFTMLELYMAHENYIFAMDFIEQMLRQLAYTSNPALQLSFGDYNLDFSQPFKRISLKDATIEYGGLQEQDLTPETITATCMHYNVKHANLSYGEKLFALFEETAEKKLIQPTFITKFPLETSPLSKQLKGDPAFAARFELFIAGMELANGFNELNDPFDQAARFHQQAAAHAGGNDEAMHFDQDYITALEYGLAPTVGVGIGIDRLIMLLTNTPSIKEVILFPSLRKKEQ